MGNGIRDLLSMSRKGEEALKKILHNDKEVPLAGAMPSSEVKQEDPRSDLPGMSPGQKVLSLRLTDIVPNSFQPRKVFSQEKLSGLAESLKDHGMLQPIIVRKIGQSTKYELIAGERRLRAARAAAMTEIPAIVKEADDNDTKIYALIENLQREDLNVVEKTLAIGALQKEIGDTAAAADKLRLTRRSVERYVMIYKVIISSGTLLSLFESNSHIIDFRLAEAIANIGRYLPREEFKKFVEFSNEEGIDKAVRQFRRPMSSITGIKRKGQSLSYTTKETETHVSLRLSYSKGSRLTTDDRDGCQKAFEDFMGRAIGTRNM